MRRQREKICIMWCECERPPTTRARPAPGAARALGARVTQLSVACGAGRSPPTRGKPLPRPLYFALVMVSLRLPLDAPPPLRPAAPSPLRLTCTPRPHLRAIGALAFRRFLLFNFKRPTSVHYDPGPTCPLSCTTCRAVIGGAGARRAPIMHIFISSRHSACNTNITKGKCRASSHREPRLIRRRLRQSR